MESKLFHSLHFTDQNTIQSNDLTIDNSGVTSIKTLKFQFYLPSSVEDMKELMNLLSISVGYYIDKVANFKLDKMTTLKSKKLRISVKNKIFKEVSDEREERRIAQMEAKNKMRQEKLDKMSASSKEKFLRKEEERERRRRMKKNGGRMIIKS